MGGNTLPALNAELAQALQGLLKLFPAEDEHHTAAAQVETQFERIIQDLNSTLDSIAGALQFMESQRAIMEAESITRLTELAFLFIPLSFAAALFAMQVRELAQAPPVAYFVAFALSLSATTYSLRLFARSLWVQRTKEKTLANVRSYRSRLPGAMVSNTDVVAWIFDNIVRAPLQSLTTPARHHPILRRVRRKRTDEPLRRTL
ncbi:hypothetical protein BJY00DRAFT_316568 [Aspergillus carlsbadensis]|nr:hypothetical protein BJY00DRAFT_316568 [Aspergillus carlsbadensis]